MVDAMHPNWGPQTSSRTPDTTHALGPLPDMDSDMDSDVVEPVLDLCLLLAGSAFLSQLFGRSQPCSTMTETMSSNITNYF